MSAGSRNSKKGISVILTWILACIVIRGQSVVRYDLYVRDTVVNFAGKEKRAIAVNGQIPMPILTFTEGDTAEIYVHNELSENTSLHWHGVFLPNKEDGVPYLTQMPIAPGASYRYRFPVIQNGTHWYHSHYGLQEQIGMYGSFVMLKRKSDPGFRKGIDDLPAFPVILSEWTNYKPENVHRMLHNATDWFAIRKDAAQSYSEAARQGYLGVKLANEWKRMLAMDVSDVYYDKFLVNGVNEDQIKTLKGGDRIRLRVSNAGASSYFWLQYAGGKMTVVASDGNDVEPVEVDRVLIAVSETYDIILTIPQDSIAYEFLATPEDRTKSASLWLGNGVKKLANPLPRLKYFEGMKMMNGMMKMNGNLDDMGMHMSLNRMDMNVVMYPEITGEMPSRPIHRKDMDSSSDEAQKYNSNALSNIVTLNYAMLRSPAPTKLSEGPVRTFFFTLTGNMNRYVWSLDNKVVSEADKILVKKGENIRIVLYNNTMMRHPMHLHGHDFRLLNGQGDHAPMKNIVDIMPMETDTLEFQANVYGDWFFHCHILYHMMSGMGRVVTYQDQPPNPEIANPGRAIRKLFADDRKFHLMAENDFATNGNDGMLMVSNTRWQFSSEWRLGYHDMHGYEVENHFGRYIGRMQWLMPFIGYDYRSRTREGEINYQARNIFGQINTKDTRKALSIGIEYTLPLLVKLETEIFTNGVFLIQLKRDDIPLSKRLRAHFIINSDKEYMVGLQYVLRKYLALRVHYDSDMGFGVGVNLSY